MLYQGLTLDPFQRRAIEAIDAGRSVLVAAPTGTGKTLIADYLVDQVLREGGRIIYTAPIKALSNQKFRDYTRLYGPDRVGLVTGDIVVRSDAPLRVMTTEILRNILLQGSGAQGEPDQLGDLRAVIFDELHFLDDPERGTVWEEVLIYLPQQVRVLGLSATMPNIDELAGWLEHVRPGQGPIAVIQERKRAVPLHFLLANNQVGLVPPERFEAEHRRWRKAQAQQPDPPRNKRRGRNDRRGRRDNDEEQTTFRDLIRLLEPRDLPALFFVFSRRVTENFARGIAGPRGEGYLSRDERADVQARLDSFEAAQPGVLSRTHLMMYERGVAFHHAGLHVQLKALVEELYEARLIKILFCTSTFALGINMPARTVLFEALEKYNGKEVAPLTVRQFMQKAGRAGRRGLDAEGQVVLRMEMEDWQKQRDYIQRLIDGQDEPVQSSFNLSFHSVVNLMARHSEDEIKDLLSRSFLAWQRARKHDAIRDQITAQQARVQMAQRAAARSAELSEAHDQSARKLERDLEKLKRRLEREQLFLWNQFQEKVKFLKELNYLDKKGGFGAGARVLRVVQIEELFVGEMILAGIFEGLRAEELYALSVGLTQELPPRVQVALELPAALSTRLRSIDAILKGDIIERAVALAGGEPRCDARMMALGYHWAAGVSMPELLRRVRSEHDISGDIVGALRRAKDLVGQLRALYEEEDPELAAALKRVMREVSRDEVEVI
jgi:superfamily II RNA helicase